MASHKKKKKGKYVDIPTPLSAMMFSAFCFADAIAAGLGPASEPNRRRNMVPMMGDSTEVLVRE